MAITIAWGPLDSFDIGERMVVQGRRFDLLPAGTMFKASGMLHGVMGLPLRQVTTTKLEVMGASFALVGWAGTPRESLLPFAEQILAAYRLAQLQFGAGAPAGE
jgi:hypothetical protein